MKNIMTITATVACAFALTACGGGSSSNNATTLSQADEGIWSNLNNGDSAGMQAVILSNGTYWGIYGIVQPNGGLDLYGILNGTASVSGNSVSGAYTYDSGTFSGTVSTQNNLNLTFNDPSNDYFMISVDQTNFDMSYDSIYNQPMSLSAIAGSYSVIGYGANCPVIAIVGETSYCDTLIRPNNLTISGSSLTLDDPNGNVVMAGTIAQHGTTSVFDVSLTAAVTGATAGLPGNLSAGTVYNGILFQTSFGILKGDIEIVAMAGNSPFFYLGSK